MTFAELEALVASIDLKSYPMPLTLEVKRAEYAEAAEIVAELNTKERESGFPTSVFCVEHIVTKLLSEMPSTAVLGFIHRLLKRIVLHELDEHIRIDGKLAFDPHAPAVATQSEYAG